MIIQSKLFSLFCILMLVGACTQNQEKSKNEKTEPGRTLDYNRTLTFLTTKGDTLSVLDVAVADDNAERSQGLMDVRQLPPDKGMLFIFEKNQPRSFWMVNTPLPLDIIFVNDRREIVRIHHSTQPFSEKSLSSGEPAKYVIETNAGYCIAHDIQEGMQVDL